jgi:hypothetical protein
VLAVLLTFRRYILPPCSGSKLVELVSVHVGSVSNVPDVHYSSIFRVEVELAIVNVGMGGVADVSEVHSASTSESK